MTAVLNGSPAHANPPANEWMEVEKVVLLMRHGVTSGDWTEEIAPGNGRDLTDFTSVNSPLTGHGGPALKLWGDFHRRVLAAHGVLPRYGRLIHGQVVAYSSHLHRARTSAEAFLEGLAPESGLRAAFTGLRPLFHPPADGLTNVDTVAIRQAVVMGLGVPLEHASAYYRASLEAVEHQLALPPGIVSTARWRLIVDRLGVRVLPLQLVAHFLDTVRMRYAGNLPTGTIGLGGVENEEELAQLLDLRAVYLDATRHPRFLALRHGVPLFGALSTSLLEPHGPDHPAVVLYVGHDTNIASIRAILGFHWQSLEGLRNDAGPGAILKFERIRLWPTGRRYVRVSFASPTMDQIHHLEPFDDDAPPYAAVFMPPPGLAPPGATLMPLESFEILVNDAFDEIGMCRANRPSARDLVLASSGDEDAPDAPNIQDAAQPASGPGETHVAVDADAPPRFMARRSSRAARPAYPWPVPEPGTAPAFPWTGTAAVAPPIDTYASPFR